MVPIAEPLIGMTALVPLGAAAGIIVVFAVIVWAAVRGSPRRRRSGFGWLFGTVVSGAVVAGLLGVGVSFRAHSFSPRHFAAPEHTAEHWGRAKKAAVSPAQVSPGEVSLPQWTRHACREISQVGSTRTQVVLQSGLFATREEAEADVLHKAARLVTLRVAPAQSFWTGNWTPDPSFLKRQLVRRTEVQSVPRDFGGIVATMYRQFVQLDLSPKALRPLREDRQRFVARHRVLLLTYALAGLVVFLGLVSTWLRSERPRRISSETSRPGLRATV